MNNDSHLGSRCGEAELQPASGFISAVNKDNVIKAISGNTTLFKARKSCISELSKALFSSQIPLSVLVSFLLL